MSNTFQYSCFISYRHGHPHNDDPVRRLFEHFAEELELHLDPPVFRDQEQLRGGHLFNPAIAASLCRSICMIALYTPTYFSRDKTYCAREYYAMERIEEIRRHALPPGPLRTRGFIIPIVLRGEESIPAAIRQHRQCHNFERFALRNFRKDITQYREQLRDIASYVREIRDEFQRLDIDPCVGCDEFPLPGDNDIGPWLNALIPPNSSFPRM